ncbi:hypothetical protein EG68_05575 [Paragonimus skrjabini miyazakii]|uniref:Uncharacterized protein n=1 Tax=Paragonimus skrjabini miyazakii TaxID=59628 RepID=A0A8S9YYZ6_9TREM|nr:hypothetical protein EG68_05575 [Paragonimus skrjabini miyazakii]
MLKDGLNTVNSLGLTVRHTGQRAFMLNAYWSTERYKQLISQLIRCVLADVPVRTKFVKTDGLVVHWHCTGFNRQTCQKNMC